MSSLTDAEVEELDRLDRVALFRAFFAAVVVAEVEHEQPEVTR
jgi:hypothetical protein